MRRFFVIFLILLFPLNVLALSLSASSMQQAGAAQRADAAAVAADPLADVSASTSTSASTAGEARGSADIDPDEPPASGDFHESLDEHSRLRFLVPPAWSGAPYAPPLHDHPAFAPVKPPPRG